MFVIQILTIQPFSATKKVFNQITCTSKHKKVLTGSVKANKCHGQSLRLRGGVLLCIKLHPYAVSQTKFAPKESG